jgi:hypothetical protein
MICSPFAPNRLNTRLVNPRCSVDRQSALEAAATALDREARWIRLSENLAKDDESQAIQRLKRLMQLSEESSDSPEDMGSLDRVQAHIKRTVRQLTAISYAIRR